MRWWRVFVDRLTNKHDETAPVGPRRRRDIRYGYQAKLTAKCTSWPKFIDLFTGDVSKGGLYVPTDQQAEIGERVEVELTLPNGKTFSLMGTIVNVVDAERAARYGKHPGLGIKLDELEGELKEQFDTLLAVARASQPVPDESSHAQAPAAAASEQPGGSSGGADAQAASNHTPPVSQGAPPPGPPAPAIRSAAGEQQPSGDRPLPGAAAAAPASQEIIIGIDLGTTYTSVSAVRGRRVVILNRDDGSHSAPSVIWVSRTHEIVVGAKARERVATDPAHTVVSPKRLLGRQYTDREVQTFTGQVPFRTFAGPDGTTVVEIWQREYSITQICSYLLRDVREVAERRLGVPVSKAVITVPISFDEGRIKSLERAAKLAGLEVLAFIDEPSAAALANRYDAGFGGIVGIYDFGGGTFDFSIVDVSQGDFRVLATSGDTWLGGDDIDRVLAEAVSNQFWAQHRVDLTKQAVEWQRLVFACELAKRTLSEHERAAISVPEVLRTAQGMIDLNIAVDRNTLARVAEAIIHRSFAACNHALRLVGMRPGDLTSVYLSGGTTRMPVVKAAVEEFFQVPVRTGVPVEHAVCLGAAIHAAELQLNQTRTLASATRTGPSPA